MFCNFIIHQLICLKLIVIVLSNPIKVLEKGILPLETHSIALQFFIDLENDEKSETCILNTKPDKCCLYDTDKVDCESMKLIGKHEDLLKAKDRKIYLFFYLSMFQLGHEGYCKIDLFYRCDLSGSTNEVIRIPFNTRLNKKQTPYLLRNLKRKKTTKCKSIDEDPSNYCRPVDCVVKYSGAKPFFHKEKRKCIEAAKCISNINKSLPDVVYDPSSNTCKDLDHSLSISDIYAISSGLGVIMKPTDEVKDKNENANVVVYKTNYSSISQNVLFLKDLIFGKLDNIQGYSVNVQESYNDACISIFATIFGISTIIVLFICFGNAGLIVYKEWKSGHDNKITDIKSYDARYDECCSVNRDRRSKEVANKLLKQVIVSELPLELRESVVDICERIGKEVRWKRRYRMIDDGSDINLKPISSDTSTTTDLDVSDKTRILE